MVGRWNVLLGFSLFSGRVFEPILKKPSLNHQVASRPTGAAWYIGLKMGSVTLSMVMISARFQKRDGWVKFFRWRNSWFFGWGEFDDNERKLNTSKQGLYFLAFHLEKVINCNVKKKSVANDIGGIGLVQISKFHMLPPKVARNAPKSGRETCWWNRAETWHPPTCRIVNSDLPNDAWREHPQGFFAMKDAVGISSVFQNLKKNSKISRCDQIV